MTNLQTLSRPFHPMPPFVRQSLNDSGLMKKYRERPPYQQNDYIGWIMNAKQKETKFKRLAQMIEELRKGNLYMKMRWNQRLYKLPA